MRLLLECLMMGENKKRCYYTVKVHGIYSNNLVRTDHVCSCLVTSAAWEWINQSHDDRYPVYRFAAYQRITN